MKRRIRLISLFCILSLLAGCGLPGSIQETLPGVLSPAPQAESSGQEEFHAPLYSDAEPAVLWGREQLTDHAKAAYDRMSQAIACRQEAPVEVDADAGEIDLILTALRIDHPEYFWFDGEASFVTTTLAGEQVRTECTFTYTMELPEIQTAHQQVRQYTAACLASSELAAAQTDYEKILGVYRYVINSTDYVLSETDQSIVSVMGRHQATCAGYARSFQYLMNQLGIPCTLALGLGDSGESHGWNMVMCGGSWYQMDVTWGDPVTPEGQPGSSLQYTYCLVTDEEIYRDHTLDSAIPMPQCTSTADNYFVREGRYFTLWDAAAYEYAMAQAAGQEDWFSVRFGDSAAYEAALAALFDRGEILDMLIRCGVGTDQEMRTRVVYTQNDLFYEISVLLSETESSGRNES